MPAPLAANLLCRRRAAKSFFAITRRFEEPRQMNTDGPGCVGNFDRWLICVNLRLGHLDRRPR